MIMQLPTKMKHTISNPLKLHYNLMDGKYFEPIPNRNQGGKIHEFVSKEVADNLLSALRVVVAYEVSLRTVLGAINNAQTEEPAWVTVAKDAINNAA